MALHEAFGEGLAGLEAGGARARAEKKPAGRGELVGHASRQRLLGTDHRQVDVMANDYVENLGRLCRVGLDGLGDGFNARVAGRAQNGPDPWIGGNAPDEGMLSRASADHQNPHRIRGLERRTAAEAHR